jgi:radical SAM superfamily enzyme YgiQ (UPF0313 family)
MRILLVDPPGKNKGLNTGLGYLSAVLRSSHDVRVLDLNNIEMGICGERNPDLPIQKVKDMVAAEVDEFVPDLFGISVKTFTAGVSKMIFELVRAEWPRINTVAGGPHITLDGMKFVRDCGIDFGISGEGENVIVRLCKALTDGSATEDIEGLIYGKGDTLTDNVPHDMISDLDSLPYPYYGNFSSVIAQGGHMIEYPLLTSRGCPYKCTYCSMPRIMGRRWRPRAPEAVVDELKHAKHEYGCTRVAIIDDNFTLNLRRVEDICDRMISEQLNMTWNSQNGIRADRIHEGLAAKMKRSGCRYVWVGIESADERVFNAINKGEKLDDIKRGISYLKKAGIGVGGFFIVGLPYSTREADLKSVDFVRENGIDAWWFNFVPYPHTEAWAWVRKNARILRSPEGVLQYGASDIKWVFETDDYLEEERIRTFKEIHYRMGYYHCLLDNSIGIQANMKNLFRDVMTYRPVSIFSLIYFFFRYSVKSAAGRVAG